MEKSIGVTDVGKSLTYLCRGLRRMEESSDEDPEALVQGDVRNCPETISRGHLINAIVSYDSSYSHTLFNFIVRTTLES